MICGENRLFVMFNDDDGITDVAQMLQSPQQTLVVPLMQTDRRFIENVHDTNEAGTDLAGETNALCFATRQAFQRCDSMRGSRGRRR